MRAKERVTRVHVRPLDWAAHDMGPFTGEPKLCRRCDQSWHPPISRVGACDPSMKGRRRGSLPSEGSGMVSEGGASHVGTPDEERNGTMGDDMTESEQEMASRLSTAGKTAEKAAKARRERDVRGSHLLEDMLGRARVRGLTVDEKSGFHMVVGPAGKRHRVYIAKKGGRADLSGFTVDHPAVTQVTEEEARTKHLGKVRGHLDFARDDADVLAAYEAALDVLSVPAPAPAPATDSPAPAGE